MWPIEDESEYTQEQYTTVSERLLGVVFGVAAQIVEEDICSMEDVDRGAKVGSMARGPFEMMNRIGVGEAYDGIGLPIACRCGCMGTPFIFESIRCRNNWDFSYVDSSTEDGIATITINRPEAMNALNEVVVAQLTEAVQAANSDSNVSTIVLDGAGHCSGCGCQIFVDRFIG